MHKHDIKFTDTVLSSWPEVLHDIDIHAIPIKYLRSITIEFHNGRIWVVDFKSPKSIGQQSTIKEQLYSLFREYQDDTSCILLSINTGLLKTDISKEIKKIC